ncbi:MAG: SIMPL domain-containing protein [Chloroflexota bacterium]|nr:SIMPL domain-containing protein [Chloroflexota bacterium]
MSSPVAPRIQLRHRTYAAGGVLAVAVLLVACATAGTSPHWAAPTADAAAGTAALARTATGPSVPTGGIATSGSGVGADGLLSGASGSSTGAVAGASIAYPYLGSLPIAPDHTIVVTGTGSAAVASDGSNRAATERSAIAAALADARAQADAVASAAHVTIDGVLSVSASLSPYVVYPLGIETPSTSGKHGATPPTAVNVPGPTQLSASATVAYTIH